MDVDLIHARVAPTIRARFAHDKEKFARVFDVSRRSGDQPVEHVVREQPAEGGGELGSPGAVIVEIQHFVIPSVRVE